MAFPPGFEPGAFRLGGGRSILLSYGNLLFGCVGWRVYLHYLRRRTLYPAEVQAHGIKLVLRGECSNTPLGGERSILLSYGDMFNSPTTTASA